MDLESGDLTPLCLAAESGHLEVPHLTFRVGINFTSVLNIFYSGTSSPTSFQVVCRLLQARAQLDGGPEVQSHLATPAAVLAHAAGHMEAF